MALAHPHLMGMQAVQLDSSLSAGSHTDLMLFYHHLET